MAEEEKRKKGVGFFSISQLKEESAEILKQIEFKEKILRVTGDVNKQNEIRLDQEELINKYIEKQTKLYEYQNTIIGTIDTGTKKVRKSISDWLAPTRNIGNIMLSIKDSLMESDRVIRRTTRSFGLTGEKAAILRNNMQNVSGFAAGLGASMEDLGTAYTTYANETGRARIHSEESLKSIISIGRATGIGAENATKLVAQYSLMSVNTESASNHILGVLETSERMGVSADNVLNNINDNFKRLRTFTFLQGVKGFAQMAAYAEKMRIDMGQALDSAESARRLDNAIEMAAQLQVMGGEFAKTDPFELLFLARNDPEQYAKKINEMTKGVISFRKMADGTFEQFMSPADRDRLTRAADVLGLQKDELIEQGRRMAEIQQIRAQMFGTGLSSSEKEIIEGIAKFDNETKKFIVEIGDTKANIEDLNRSQLKGFAAQAKSLEDRAKAALTFDEALKATIEELKLTLMPILNGINAVLKFASPLAKAITNAVGWFASTNFGKAFLTGAGLLLAGATILRASGILTLGKTLIGFAKWMYKLIKLSKTRGVGAVVSDAVSRTKSAGSLATQSAPSATQTILGKDGRALNAPALKAQRLAEMNHAKAMLSFETKRTALVQKRVLYEQKAMGRSAAGAAGGKAVAGAGMGAAAGKGIGVGVAALGIGAGIGLAALGIAELAKAMKDLDSTQIYALPATVFAIGVSGSLMAASMKGLSVAILKLSASSVVAAKGLAIFAGFALAVGGSIALAAFGVGYMVNSLANLISNAKDAGPAMLSLGLGIGAISLSMIGFNLGLSGMIAFSFLLRNIAKRAPQLEKVGDAFSNIKAVLSGSFDDFREIEKIINAISNFELKDKSAFSELKNLFNKPLKVEFSDRDVNFTTNVTLKLDGQTIANKIAVYLPNKIEANRTGK